MCSRGIQPYGISAQVWLRPRHVRRKRRCAAAAFSQEFLTDSPQVGPHPFQPLTEASQQEEADTERSASPFAPIAQRPRHARGPSGFRQLLEPPHDHAGLPTDRTHGCFNTWNYICVEQVWQCLAHCSDLNLLRSLQVLWVWPGPMVVRNICGIASHRRAWVSG